MGQNPQLDLAVVGLDKHKPIGRDEGELKRAGDRLQWRVATGKAAGRSTEGIEVAVNAAGFGVDRLKELPRKPLERDAPLMLKQQFDEARLVQIDELLQRLLILRRIPVAQSSR